MEHIKIENLSFSYPNSKEPALLDINMDIKRGEYICICGKSGSGKTTLLKNIKSVLCPVGKKEGAVYVENRDVTTLNITEQAALLGYVGQNPDSQIVTDKVWHELAFGLENLGVNSEKIRIRVAEMASFFGITEWFYRDTDSLSGGEKQICNLASIMTTNPEILILDEPTSQLDPVSAKRFLNLIKELNRDFGITIIITEHRLEDIVCDVDRLAVMENGKLIHFDEPKEVCRELYLSKNSVFKSMPAATKIFFNTDGTGDVPLSVREGIGYLNSKLSDKIIKNSIKDDKKTEKKEAALQVKNLYFRYQKNEKDIINGLNLEIKIGEIYSILGANGAGKTTLLYILLKNLRTYSGKIAYFGDKKTDSISCLPQNPQTLFSKNTVSKELLSDEKNEDYKNELIELCELNDILDKHPYDISYGQKQRVALCKVLLKKPKLLLLDEPTKGIDWYYREKLGEILTRLKDNNTTILMVSHDIEFCAKYSDKTGLLFDGKILSEGSPREFFSNNNFYTTNANKISGFKFKNAVTVEDVEYLCKANISL